MVIQLFSDGLLFFCLIFLVGPPLMVRRWLPKLSWYTASHIITLKGMKKGWEVFLHGSLFLLRREYCTKFHIRILLENPSSKFPLISQGWGICPFLGQSLQREMEFP